MKILEYEVIGTENQDIINTTRKILDNGYVKYNLTTDASLVVEYGDENTLTLLDDDVEEPLGEEYYNVLHLEDEIGKMDVVLINKMYLGDNILNLVLALSNLLAEQYFDKVNTEDEFKEDEFLADALEAIIFSFSSYLATELVEYDSGTFNKEKIKLMFTEALNNFDSFIEREDLDTMEKINSLLELIGYLFKADRYTDIKDVLKSNHITIKTISALQEKLFRAFISILNTQSLSIDLVCDITDLLDALTNIV